MKETISIAQFIRAIQRLSEDEPQIRPGIWYKTQKEHWLESLKGYQDLDGYGRNVDNKRDARFAYNHIVNYEMLLWIISAAGVKSGLVHSAQRASTHSSTLQQKSAAIRSLVHM